MFNEQFVQLCQKLTLFLVSVSIWSRIAFDSSIINLIVNSTIVSLVVVRFSTNIYKIADFNWLTPAHNASWGQHSVQLSMCNERQLSMCNERIN